MADVSLVQQLSKANSDLSDLNTKLASSIAREGALNKVYQDCDAKFPGTKQYVGKPGPTGTVGRFFTDCLNEGGYSSTEVSAAVEQSKQLTIQIGLKKNEISQIQTSIKSDPTQLASLKKQETNSDISKTVVYTVLGIVVFVVIVYVVKTYLI